jgi:tRNA(Ile)-lysidine synthase TilS/MesJ
MISDKKRLEIANVCYANVAGEFALFCNPKYRGPNFSWEWFIEHCEKSADLWLMVSSLHKESAKEAVKEMARNFAREIAENLVKKATE